MLIVWLFEVAVVAAFVLLATSQILVPLWRGLPLFPIFRGNKVEQVVEQLAAAQEEVVVGDYERLVNETRAKVRKQKEENHVNN